MRCSGQTGGTGSARYVIDKGPCVIRQASGADSVPRHEIHRCGYEDKMTRLGPPGSFHYSGRDKIRVGNHEMILIH
jgi:hypothetical protein